MSTAASQSALSGSSRLSPCHFFASIPGAICIPTSHLCVPSASGRRATCFPVLHLGSLPLRGLGYEAPPRPKSLESIRRKARVRPLLRSHTPCHHSRTTHP